MSTIRNNILPLILCGFILITAHHSIVGQNKKNSSPKREFRATWVGTVFNLDWPSASGLSVEEQQLEFKYILDQNQKLGLNAIVVQVRTQADAFYQSSYEPWSQYLSGEQGKYPGYDPMEFMIEECHKRNMEFHAWFNIFRGVSHKSFIPVSDLHKTKTKPEWFFEYKSGLFFDPGIPEVREYLMNVILEAVENYDIDGVHLDDYFYPNELSKEHNISDKKTYRRDKRGFRKIEDWRRDNIDLLIQELYLRIKARKKHVKFGVSPFPVWRHKFNDREGSETDRTSACYDNYFADTKKWIQNGWVDYLSPQFYWGHEFRRVPFHVITSWWNDHSYGRPIYGGLAYYKLNNRHIDPRKDPSWNYQNEIFDQVNQCRKLNNFCGVCFYSQSSFNKNRRMFTVDLKADYFMNPALQPRMPWLDNVPPDMPKNLRYTIESDSVKISWDGPTGSAQQLAYQFAVYLAKPNESFNFNTGDNLVSITREKSISFPLSEVKNSTIYVTSLDRLHNESKNFVGTYIEVEE